VSRKKSYFWVGLDGGYPVARYLRDCHGEPPQLVCTSKQRGRTIWPVQERFFASLRPVLEQSEGMTLIIRPSTRHYGYFDATIWGYVIAARSAFPYRCQREFEPRPVSLYDSSNVMMGIPRVRPAYEPSEPGFAPSFFMGRLQYCAIRLARK